MSNEDAIKFQIINEYEEVLTGKRKQFSKYYFTGNPSRDSDIALYAFRYLFDKILCWDIPTIEQNLTMKLIKDYKLDKYLMSKLIFANEIQKKPRLVKGELTEPDVKQLIHMMYPKRYKVDIRESVIKVYKDLLEGNIIKKFPKGFFSDGSIGYVKACICLQYAVNTMGSFTSVEHIYRTFADRNIFSILRPYKLDLPCKALFEYPIDFLHMALPTKLKDENLYEEYRKQYQQVIADTNRKY